MPPATPHRFDGSVPPRAKIGAVVALVAVVFMGALACGFVWDDHFQVRDNLYIRSPRLIPLYFRSDLWVTSSVETPSGYYRPLQNVSYALDHALWGLDPAGFHLTGIALHLLCCAAFYWLALRTGLSERAAIWATLFAAIHPTRAEAIGFLGARGDLLSCLFLLLSALVIARARDQNARAARTTLSGAGLLLFLAMLSKPWALLWPVVWGMLAWYGAADRGREDADADTGPVLRRAVGLCLGGFIPIALFFGVQALALPLGMNQGVSGAPLWVMLARATDVAGLYLRKILWPLHQTAIYDVHLPETIFAWSSAAWMFVLVPLALVIAVAVRARRPAGFWAAFFFLAVAPHAALVRFGGVTADRYDYTIALGLCALLGIAVDRAWGRGGRTRTAGVAIGAALLLAFGVLTIHRTAAFFDDTTLMGDAAHKAPNSIKARTAYTTALVEAGRTHEALAYANAGIAHLGQDRRLLIARAEALVGLGRRDEAAAVYRRVALDHPRDATAFARLAYLELDAGRVDRAAPLLARAVALDDRDTLAAYDLALARDRMGETDAAIAGLRRLRRLTPDSPRVNTALGRILWKRGERDEARSLLQRSLFVDPNQPDVRALLAAR